MSPTRRCPCYTLKGTKCKHKINTHMNVCWVHYKQLYTKYAESIQYAWDTYKCRRISALFTTLPTDIQAKIVWYIQEPQLIQKHHHQVITKIIKSRVEASVIARKIPQTIVWAHHLDDIQNLCDLYKKYYNIIPLDDRKNFLDHNYTFLMNMRRLPFFYDEDEVSTMNHIYKILFATSFYDSIPGYAQLYTS